MHLVDHLFILLLFVVQPIYGAFESRRVHACADAGEPLDRQAFYRNTMFMEWTFLFVLFVAWYQLRRPLEDLGIVAPGGLPFWIGLAIVIAMTVALLHACHRTRRLSPEEKQQQAESFGKLVRFLPHTRKELNLFYGVSLTAGVVEEIVYRGFVLWYLGQFMPVWVAIAVSSAAFGLAHSYQGPANATKCGLLGLAFGVLYVYSGSIWLPIVAHAILDILQGKAIHELLRNSCYGQDRSKQQEKARSPH